MKFDESQYLTYYIADKLGIGFYPTQRMVQPFGKFNFDMSLGDHFLDSFLDEDDNELVDSIDFKIKADDYTLDIEKVSFIASSDGFVSIRGSFVDDPNHNDVVIRFFPYNTKTFDFEVRVFLREPTEYLERGLYFYSSRVNRSSSYIANKYFSGWNYSRGEFSPHEGFFYFDYETVRFLQDNFCKECNYDFLEYITTDKLRHLGFNCDYYGFGRESDRLNADLQIQTVLHSLSLKDFFDLISGCTLSPKTGKEDDYPKVYKR